MFKYRVIFQLGWRAFSDSVMRDQLILFRGFGLSRVATKWLNARHQEYESPERRNPRSVSLFGTANLLPRLGEFLILYAKGFGIEGLVVFGECLIGTLGLAMLACGHQLSDQYL